LYSRLGCNALVFEHVSYLVVAGNEVNFDHLQLMRVLGGVHMDPVLVLNETTENNFTPKGAHTNARFIESQTLLIATIDPDIRAALAELLYNAGIKGIWVRSVKEVKSLIAKQRISACLCGLWLQDGTYREIIRHLRREGMDIPVIIVSAPACPQEFRDYLAAMNLGALDVLSYPYEQSEFERMLEFAISSRARPVPQKVAEKASQFKVRGAA
jgi:CheY-like chemotaxis protein